MYLGHLRYDDKELYTTRRDVYSGHILLVLKLFKMRLNFGKSL